MYPDSLSSSKEEVIIVLGVKLIIEKKINIYHQGNTIFGYASKSVKPLVSPTRELQYRDYAIRNNHYKN